MQNYKQENHSTFAKIEDYNAFLKLVSGNQIKQAQEHLKNRRWGYLYLRQLYDSSINWKNIGEALKGSWVTNLILGMNSLYKASANQLKAIGEGLNGSGVTTLDLSNNGLSNADKEKLKAIGEGLNGSGVTTLDLSNNYLNNADNEQLEYLGEGLKNSGVRNLNLSSNNLTFDQLISILDELQDSQVTEPFLNDSDLSKASSKNLKNLCEKLKKTKVTTLHLNRSKLGSDKLESLLQGLKESKVTYLSLIENNNNETRGNYTATFVKSLGKGLQGFTGINTLFLSGNDFGSVPKAFQDLWEGLQQSGVKELDLSMNNLGSVSIKEFKGLWEGGLKGSKVTTLHLMNNNLDKAPADQLKNLGEGLKESNVTTLNLIHNNLGNAPAEKLKAIGEGLKGSKVTTMNLRSNNFYDATNEKWMAIGAGLKESGVTTLNLSDNGLALCCEQLETNVIGEGLKGSGITTLHLCWNDLNSFSAKKLKNLGEGLKESNVTTLDLSYNNLGNAPAEKLKAIGEGLKGSKVTTLLLSGNNLPCISDQQLGAFCDGLKESGVTALDLSASQDETEFKEFLWNKDQLKTLAKALEKSSIKKINLSGHGINQSDMNEITQYFNQNSKQPEVLVYFDKECFERSLRDSPMQNFEFFNKNKKTQKNELPEPLFKNDISLELFDN